MRVRYPSRVDSLHSGFDRASAFWLLAVSLFLIGFFAGTDDEPTGRTRNAVPPARTG